MLTAAIFISLTVYTLNTKTDFSFLGAGLFAGLVVLIVWGLLNMFFDFGIGGRMVFSLLGALLFAGAPLPLHVCGSLAWGLRFCG